MPNWVSNRLELTGSLEQINDIKRVLEETNGEDFFNIFVADAKTAGKEDEWYSYNIDTYGCKWNCNADHWELADDDSTIIILFNSPWSPPLALYETLYGEHDMGIKAYYDECGMCFCGFYAGAGDAEYYEYGGMTADEIDEEIPPVLNDLFGIAETVRSYEEENDVNDN